MDRRPFWPLFLFWPNSTAVDACDGVASTDSAGIHTRFSLVTLAANFLEGSDDENAENWMLFASDVSSRKSSLLVAIKTEWHSCECVTM